jgi:hypothetical protein
MLKRTLAILATGAVAAIALAPSAGAIADPKLDPYGAGAYANALEITLLGQDLAVSNTSAAITSTPEAKADGSALLLAGTPLPGNTPSATPGGQATNKSCAADINLGQLTGGAISLADAGLACINTATLANATVTAASSASGELTINVTAPAGSVLEPILGPLGDAVTQSVLTPLLDALAPLTGAIKDATQIDLPAVVNELIGKLTSADADIVIAQIAVAPTAAEATASNADGVLAQAGSSGATISVLPDLLQSLRDLGLNLPAIGPLATIKIGPSQAKVHRDATTGAADPDVSSAKLLDIQLAPQLGLLSQITGQLTSVLEQLTGATGALGCNPNNPLADIVCVDLGNVKELSKQELKDRNLDFGEGTVGREASAATVRVLPILGDTLGGDLLAIRLGTSTAAANATPKAVVPATVPLKALPKTGGMPSMPVAFFLVIGAGAAIALVRRSRVTA